ncbi:nicotinate-nucleotide--dimethylbenzimidazole phosphoribosyltransferase [Streptomyces sp. NRRL S-1022]|uniref:nicotinate-nucleotide--dimethylbenzimidazole phosphoribosyltransferase n=1 Tax=Streptomyces sp. NRRL S-1022 TaxID=1463880 RepID=UPI0004BF146E|nr:nicotinate-nucleotide--dimethylbenzimidazole phosphoribosyltransferase [Streptomyces sp. NRRL S-1022]
MTDTGQVPGEGQPESAGMVEQPGVPTHGAYTYLSEAPAEDEDLLLPGAQGAWGNEVPPPAPEPVVEAVHEPGPHETAGRDSGSVDLNGVRLPDSGPVSVTPSPILSAPHDPGAAPQPPRRPLHLGPPIPDASASPVRSLADRGPAGAPVRQPAGPEYLDAQPLREMTPQSAAPWGSAPGQVGAQAPAAETVSPPAPAEQADAAQTDAAQAAMARLASQAAAQAPVGDTGQVPVVHGHDGVQPVHAHDGVYTAPGTEGAPAAEAPAAPVAVAAPEGAQVAEVPGGAQGAEAGAGQAQPMPEAAAVEQFVPVEPAPERAVPAGAQSAETPEAAGSEAGPEPVVTPVAPAGPVDGALPAEAVQLAEAVQPAEVMQPDTAQPAEAPEAAAVQAPDAAQPAGVAQPAEAPEATGAEAVAAAAQAPDAVPAPAAEPTGVVQPAEAPSAVVPAPAPDAVQPTGVTQPVEAPEAVAVAPQAADAVQAPVAEPTGVVQPAEAPSAVAPVQAPAAEPTGVVQPAEAPSAVAPEPAPDAAQPPGVAQPVEAAEATGAEPAAVAPQTADAVPAPVAEPTAAAQPVEAPEAAAPAQAPDAAQPAGVAQPLEAPEAAVPVQPTPVAQPLEAPQATGAEPAAAVVPPQAPAEVQPPAGPQGAPEVTEPAAAQGVPLPAEAAAPLPESARQTDPAPAPAAADVAQPAVQAAEPVAPEAPAVPTAPAQPAPDAVPAAAPVTAEQPAVPGAAEATEAAVLQAAQGPQLAEGAAQQPVPDAAAPGQGAEQRLPSGLPVEPDPEQPLGQFVPVEGQVPTTPHLAPTPPQPLILPLEDPQVPQGPQEQPEEVATVPAPREGEPDLVPAAPEAEPAPDVVQHAEDLQTRAADQEESTATVAEARQSTGPAAPGYADAEREAVLKVMRERRDIRNGFRSDPIPHEVLLRVLEAAHTAPSVGHSQPWDFVVIRSAETRRTMHELAMRQREAYAKSLPKGRAKQFKELKIEAILDTPVNIVVTADPTRGGRHTLGRHTQPQMAPYSSALAVENLWLAARAEGLGVGWVSFFDEREMVRALGLPEHLEVVAYLCVGYVDEFPDEPELMQAGWSKRRPLSWVVHEETYGRRALPGEEPHDLLAETVAQIRPLDAKALGEAWERQKRMTKPAGALGMLEIISAQLSGLSRQCPPPIPEPAAVAIFAGDHGVHAQGVTPWPQEVTAQMVANFLGGGAVCNAFAAQVGAEVCVVDVGVAADLPATPGLLPRKIRGGTSDMTTGPAMTREEAKAAIEVGIETARDLVAAGNKALLTGEMGIANTTSSAALISVFTGADPAEVTGRGTGINDETLARKTEVVRRALELHQPDPADPIGVLAAIGGFEHAAIVGLLLGGASLRTPVILDGVSAGAAALVARAIAPEVLAACIAGHRSAEPGHVAALNKLGLRPLVDLDLRLGEGTGALLALPLVQSTARAMHEVATFDSAGVTEK